MSSSTVLGMDRCDLCGRRFREGEGTGLVGRTRIWWVHQRCWRKKLQQKKRRRQAEGATDS